MLKEYKLRSWNLETIIKQNAAIVEDCIEGCLLDDLYLITKRGYMLLLETYATTNSSIYTLFFDTDSRAIDEIWENRKQAYFEETGVTE